MQNIDNNMDELYRKAAEKYEPGAAGNSWNAIKERLSASQSEPAVPLRKNNHLKRNMLFLLLLTFATTNYFYSPTDSVLRKPAVAQTNNSTQKNESKKTPVTKDFLLASDKAKTVKKLFTTSSEAGKNKSFFHPLNASLQSYTPATLKLETPASISFNKNNDKEIMQRDTDSDVAVNKETEQFVNNPPKADSNQPARSKQVNIKRKESTFYAGVLAGVSVNQVRQQGFRKAGLEAGLLAGFKINKKLSVETGLQYDKKYYFSDGKYFSMEKMPANMKVLSLTGYSQVIEIPLIVKYNVVKTKTAAAFVSAGVSSYLLTKESNQYITLVNGSQQNMNGMYKHVSADFVSSLNIGFGYEKTVKKSVTIRIEPFANIPVKGTGIGNMRVMNAGLHIAATMPFH